MRGPNADRWGEKLAANRARDLAANAALADAGWTVLRIWECEIRQDVQAAAANVRAAAQAEVGKAGLV